MNKREDLEEFAKQLQEQILEQIKKRYSETVIEYLQNPRNFTRMERSDGYAQVKGPCGDTT